MNAFAAPAASPAASESHAQGDTPLPLPRALTLLIAGGAPPADIIAAALEAERIATSPLDVLLCSGAVSEIEIVDILARELGAQAALSLDDLRDFASHASAGRAGEILRAGFLREGGQSGRILVAARGEAIEKMIELADALPGFGERLIIAPPRLFAAYVRHTRQPEIMQAACAGPARLDPNLSSAHLDMAAGPVVLGALLLVAALLTSPHVTAALVELALALLFLAHGLLRALALGAPGPIRPRRLLPDRLLPVYTVLVPLHREARVLPDLVETLRGLDYPPSKLEILLLLEEGDADTIAAARALALPPPFEILVVPAVGPKTKPKALNVGLLGARGQVLVVFDAEDRPEPDQLRIAASRLGAGGKTLGCVQAALSIDNARPKFLSRLFLLDYAALFDGLLPALGAHGLPMPLGGTSNHFPTRVLREVGGWDPSNVTEDADLGVRLARFGYRSESIASTTHEEAVAELWPWIRQRTRWMKGYIVTWLVHARHRGQLVKDLGRGRALVAELLLLCTPLAAMAHLALFVMVPLQLASGTFLTGASWLSLTADTVTMAALVIGYAAAILLVVQGLFRRRRLGLLPWITMLPFYWMLMAVAAIRAVSQLGQKARSDWEKTEHGVEERAPRKVMAAG